MTERAGRSGPIDASTPMTFGRALDPSHTGPFTAARMAHRSRIASP